jgi:RHS repeat-associated protein
VVVRGVAGVTTPNPKIYRVDRQVYSRLDYENAAENPITGSPIRSTFEQFSRDPYGNIYRERHETQWRESPTDTTSKSSWTQADRLYEPPGVETTTSFHEGRFLGLAINETSTGNHDGTAAEARTVAHDWDVPLRQLRSTTVEPQGDADYQLLAEFDYTADGLAYRTTETAVGTGRRRVNEVVFDSLEGMFPESITNSIGHVSLSFVDPALGLPVWGKDANGLIVRTQYDGFGRTKAVIGAQSARVETSYGATATNPLLVTTTTATGGASRTGMDRLGRETLTSQKAPDGSWADSSVRHNELGWVVERRSPYGATTHFYDDFGRNRLSTQSLEGGQTLSSTTTYPTFFEIDRTDSLGHHRQETFDGLGQLTKLVEHVREKSAHGEVVIPAEVESTTYSYRPFGLLRSATGTAAGTTLMSHDKLGRQIGVWTSSTGWKNTQYDAFGGVRGDVDSGATRVRTYVPDDLGRTVLALEVDGSNAQQSRFTYDVSRNGIGQMASATREGPDLVTTTYAYDKNFGSVVGTELRLPVAGGSSFETLTVRQTLNEKGQVDRLTYPSAGVATGPLVVKHIYGADGSLDGLVDPADETHFWWKAEERDRVGRIKRERFGNGAESVRTYAEESGRLIGLRTAKGAQTHIDLSFGYDAGGNLRSRNDLKRNTHEGFDYDDQDRLWWWYDANEQGSPRTDGWSVTHAFSRSGDLNTRRVRVNGSVTQTVTHNVVNNGTSSLWPSEAGTFGFDLAGNMNRHPGVGTITYTGFNKPRHVDGTQDIDYFYDAFGSRVQKSWDGNYRSDATTYMGGLYERRTNGSDTTHVMYVVADGRAIAQLTRNATSGTQDTRYIYGDQLGSTSVTETAAGAVEERRQDPFGNPVAIVGTTLDPRISGTPSGPRPSDWVTRGFTGHEEESELGLVNMQGRTYDPRIGRFLQADPVFQGLHSQSWNRYSYVANNPTKYVDPSGYDMTPAETDCALWNWCFQQTPTEPELLAWQQDKMARAADVAAFDDYWRKEDAKNRYVCIGAGVCDSGPGVHIASETSARLAQGGRLPGWAAAVFLTQAGGGANRQFSEQDAVIFEQAVAAEAANGGNCMTCAMAALGVDVRSLGRTRPRVHEIAAAVGAQAITHNIDFRVRGRSHGRFVLSYIGADRPSTTLAAAATNSGGGVSIFLMGLADGTHTVSVIARPSAGGGYNFSYLDQFRHPGGDPYSFSPAGLDSQIRAATQGLVNGYPTAGGGRINDQLLLWQVQP